MLKQYYWGGSVLKSFLLRLRLDLFERVSLLSKQYGISTNKMFVRLIEIGYVQTMKNEIDYDKD